MEFRLTYAGPLYATQRDALPGGRPKHAANQRHIRSVFHHQLRTLWRVIPALVAGETGGPDVITSGRGSKPLTTAEDLARRHAHYGYNFVPLVTEEMDLLCGLDILFLRADRPGSAVWAGDIDNRIKTLLDAMRIPVVGEGYSDSAPLPEEQPMFVLLEDDKLISRVAIDTDRLLEPVDGSTDPPNVRLVVTVRIKPYETHLWNMHFA